MDKIIQVKILNNKKVLLIDLGLDINEARETEIFFETVRYSIPFGEFRMHLDFYNEQDLKESPY